MAQAGRIGPKVGGHWYCHHDRATARVHSFHAMNIETAPVAADLWTNPTGLSHKPTCKQPGNDYVTRLVNYSQPFTLLFKVHRYVDSSLEVADDCGVAYMYLSSVQCESKISP